MPELPEVETVRRQLEPELVGKRITSASVLDERLTRPEPPQSLERAVAGREVTAVARRGKYLLIGLEGGRTLALHLRMTGNLLLRDSDHGETADLMKSDRLGGPRLYEPAPEPSHVRARFELDDGRTLLFTDVRRFGQAVILDAGDQLDDFFAARLGIEPLSGELTPERLLELAKDRKAPLKSFLLTQTRVAGIGNIYADEALWRARLHPLSPAGSMNLEHARASWRGSWRLRRPGSIMAGRASTTIWMHVGGAARCRTSPWSTPARGSHACDPRASTARHRRR